MDYKGLQSLRVVWIYVKRKSFGKKEKFWILLLLFLFVIVYLLNTRDEVMLFVFRLFGSLFILLS